MKYGVFVIGTILALQPVTAAAVTQSSSNYSINGGRFTSGGTSASDAAGMTKSGIAIGQGVFIPTTGSSSPGYDAKPVTPAILAAGGACGVRSGDVNCDGMVDIVDALLSLKAGVGLIQLSNSEIVRGDIGPLVNNVAVGDGRIDIEDAMLILRKAVGLAW